LISLSTELEVLSDLLTQPTELTNAFVSEDVCGQRLIVKQRLRSETEPEPVAPELTELPDEVELVAVDHVKTSKLESVEGRCRADLGTREDRPAPIWEVEWRATVRLKATERVREAFTGECRLTCRPSPQTLSPEGREGSVPNPQANALSLQIPIRLRRVEVIEASPPYTYFGRLKAGEARKRLALLRALDDQEFELKDASCDSTAYEARVTTKGPKKLHTVQVVFRSSESGQHSGSVRVATTHPRCPQVTFGVEGSVGDTGELSFVSGR
jgi:hypothetical protein